MVGLLAQTGKPKAMCVERIIDPWVLVVNINTTGIAMTMDSVGRLFASKLPSLIKQARARAVEHPQLFLKGKVTSLVQVLITYTNLDSISTPLRFNRERPAALLSVSTRTIDRLLKELESLGWLKRLPQPRLSQGGWGCTSIAWAPWVIKDIFAVRRSSNKWQNGNPHEDKKPKAATPENSAPDRATKTAHLSLSSKEEVFQNKGVSAESSKPSFDPFKESEKPSRRIPEDLKPAMKEFDLSAKDICYLMSICKGKQFWLQHLFQATWDQLKSRALKARDAVGWLIYMIKVNNRDYKFEAMQAQQRKLAKQRSERRNALLARIAAKAFTPGTQLPDGKFVLSCANDLVVLSNDGKTATSACPSAMLVESLARIDVWWVKKVLGGKVNVQVTERAMLQSHEAAKQDLPSEKQWCRDNLRSLKAILKPRSFARV